MLNHTTHTHVSSVNFPVNLQFLCSSGVELDNVMLLWKMNATLNLNWETGELVRLHFGNIIEVAAEKIVRGLRSPQVQLSLMTIGNCMMIL